MKVLSHCIQTFYLTNYPETCTVVFVHPRNKINLAKEYGEDDERTQSKKKKVRYSGHKVIVTKAVRNLLLHNNNNWKDYFEAFAKRDDLADCYMQALYWILEKHFKKQKPSKLVNVCLQESDEMESRRLEHEKPKKQPSSSSCSMDLTQSLS